MKTLYLNCQTGIAGDMTVASLLGLLPDKEAFIHKINKLYPSYHISYDFLQKYGKKGQQMKMVIDDEEEKNQDLPTKETLVGKSSKLTMEKNSLTPKEVLKVFALPEKIEKKVWKIFSLILKEQEIVHKKPMINIHFTKLGSLDALLDITSVCLLLETLEIEKVVSTPVNTGFGEVQYGDKIFQVPAPVTRRILTEVPHFHDEKSGELCTPTGVAILATLVDEFVSLEEISGLEEKAKIVSYGFGLKEFSYPSYLTSFLL